MTEAISNRWWEQNYAPEWLPEFRDASMLKDLPAAQQPPRRNWR